MEYFHPTQAPPAETSRPPNENPFAAVPYRAEQNTDGSYTLHGINRTRTIKNVPPQFLGLFDVQNIDDNTEET